MKQIIQYDLFEADPDSGPQWLETITGLDNAEKCVKERATEKPGDYFIYNVREGVLVSRSRALPKAS